MQARSLRERRIVPNEIPISSMKIEAMGMPGGRESFEAKADGHESMIPICE